MRTGAAEELRGKTPLQIRDLGVHLSFVPEDRLGMGLVGSMGMTGNVMLRSYRSGKGIFTDRKAPRPAGPAAERAAGHRDPRGQLPRCAGSAGGNVQKVLVGREIAAAPTVLMAAYPVRGLDINSSYTIYDLLNQQKGKGVAVIYVGEDLDVLLELCDRIAVLCGGKLTGLVDARKTTKAQVGTLMARHGKGGRLMEQKTPLFHIVKRDAMPLWKAWAVRLASILLALVVCAVFINSVTGLNPLSVYASMFDGAFGTNRRIWNTVNDAMILLCIALAITPAFKMRFWNIGAEGQILVGGAATAAVMRYCGESLATPALFALMVVVSLLSGLVWGLVPAWFKARWNTNETLFTLMMNYIAIQLVSYLSIKWEAVKGSGTIGVINQSTKAGWIDTGFLSGIFGRFNYSINTTLVLLITLFIFVYLNYTKHGYEIAVVGESENTARYAGISVRRVILRTVALSGALCGLVGFLLVSGSNHTISVEHRRRRWLHRHRGLLAGQVQPLRYDRHLLPAHLPHPGRRPDRQRLRPERVGQRHHHRHHPVLHSGQRVLHQLPGAALPAATKKEAE